MKSLLKPPMQKGKEPPFYEMEAIPFQELCRDLLAVQGEFTDCRIYGDNGEGQFGIDIRCDRKTGILEVAQSKCYKNFPPAEIVEVSNKFFESIQFWQKEGVKKFILIVACRITSQKANTQISIERQRFKDAGIDYELWDAIRIRDILRDNSKLIYTHIENSQFWSEQICGQVTASPFTNQPGFGVNLSLATDFNNLLTVLNSKASEELEKNRILWREGDKKKVFEWIKQKKTNIDEWKAIDVKTKAGIIRLEAITYIDFYEDFDKAENLLKAAKELDPEGLDRKYWAILALHRSGLEDSLETLSDADDIDSICARVSLLLQKSSIYEAKSLLEQLQVETSNNAEVFRLQALLHLEFRDLQKARETINQAKQIASNWESIQIADAVISYFSALSPAVFSRTTTLWPEPIELDLIKSSSEAIHALDYAAEIFRKVYQNEYSGASYRLSLKLWYAACLACNFRRQKEAENFFSSLLTDFPTDHRIISWVFYRRYPFQLQKSHQELKKKREKGLATAADIISSAMLNIQLKKVRNTLYLLESNKKLFITEGLEQLWDFWHIQTLIAQKKMSDANREFQESSYREQLKPIQFLLLSQESNEGEDLDKFIGLLIKSYEEEKDALALMEMCQYYAAKQKWQEISSYPDRLVSEIQTEKAFKIGVATLYNQGMYQECKLYIERNKSLCFDNNLPSDLILIYIQSKALSGEFPEALSDLRQIAESNPTKQNLLLLRDFYIRKGDKLGLRDVAILIKKQPDFKADELIQIANSLLWASPELAIEFFDLAPVDQLSSQHVVEKMMLGFSLGLDSEMKDIHKLIPNIMSAEGAPIRVTTFEETIDIIKQRNQQWNELVYKYNSGEIPIHFLSMNARSNLFTLYNMAFSNNNLASPKQKFPLFIRFGGRPSLVDFKEPDEPIALDHLSLDVTSLLLLDHFSLLDVFEEIGKPINLPGETVLALVNMKQSLEQYQPEIVQASKLLLELLNVNKIRKIEINSNQFTGDFDIDIILNLIDSLGNLQGFVVGFASQRNIWDSLEHRTSNLTFITIADIVENIRADAIISEVERITAIDRLGTEGLVKTDNGVPKGSNLFFVANTIQLLAQTDILNQVCSAYTVWAESSETFNIQGSVSEERNRSMYANRLQNLIDRISKGIEERKYSFLPQQKLGNEIESTAREDSLLHNLSENFIAGQSSNFLPAIDDLFIQRELHYHGVHAIGIYELVWSAFKQGLIEEARYYDLLIEFRKADLRYIPISSAEIVFHIKTASIENKAVQENSNLRILKEYISSSLITGRKIQIPRLPIDSVEAMGEFEYIINIVHSISYAVMKIWQDNVSEELKQIRSSWIFENLFLDILTLCNIVGWERDHKDHVFLVALSLAEFFLNGLQFIKDDSDKSPRKQFYDWFYYKICEPRFAANSGLLERTAELIKGSLSSQISSNANSEFDPYIRLFSQRLYQDLPDPLKTIINRDPKFLEQIGIEIISVIDVAGLMFPAANFWDNLAKTLEGESIAIEAVNPKVEVLFSPNTSKKKLSATFINPNNGEKINIESGDFVFILNANKQFWLESNYDYFCEWSASELEATISKICLLKSPAERMEELNELRKSSIGNYYHSLKEKLLSTKTLDFARLLPPSRQGLHQFFGFVSSDNAIANIEEQINLSAGNLITRLGLFTATSRISAFPIGIPTALLDEIQKLSFDERQKFLSGLSDVLITPISRLQYLRLICQFGDEEQTAMLVTSFFTEEMNIEISAFLLLLGWISDELDDLPGGNQFTAEEKLLFSWGHTNELFTIFKQVGVPFDWLISVLKERKPQLPFRYIFASAPLEWNDVIHPSRLDVLPFKILGLNYALGDNKTLSKEERDKLLNEVFPWKENNILPAVDLLEQRESYTNILHSFFGKEISNSLLSLTSGEEERITALSNSSLKNLASEAIEWLSSPDSAIAGFQFLFGLYHTQLLPKDLLFDFEKKISGFNFVGLINLNPMIVILGLYFSTCQAKQLSDDAKNHLIEELLGLAEACSKLYPGQSSIPDDNVLEVELSALLFESAVQLSKSMTENKVIDEFERLMMGILSRWSETKPIALRLLNRLYSDIPIPISHTLGKVLLEIRLLR
jgi:hypothetical protein